jgi:hypothetical protein
VSFNVGSGIDVAEIPDHWIEKEFGNRFPERYFNDISGSRAPTEMRTLLYYDENILKWFYTS